MILGGKGVFGRSAFDIIISIPAILVAFTFHEYAHAAMADRLGDKTPRFQGRLTLNPFVHIDIIGFVMILLIGFGWAKPVETNPSAYRHYYKDDLKVSLAGPLSNLVIAIITSIIIGLFLKFMNYIPYSEVARIIYLILEEILYMNAVVFFFNMIPLPGLDGFHILRDIFPQVFYKISDSLYRYQTIILIVFIVSNLSYWVVGVPAGNLSRLLMTISLKIFGI